MTDTVTKVRCPSTGGQDRSFPVPPRSYSSDRLCDLMGCRGCLTITDLQSVQQNVKRVQTGMRPASKPHFPKLEVVFCIDLASSKAPRVLAFDQFIDLRQSRSFRSSLDSGGLDQKHNSSFSFRLFCFRASSPPHTVAGFQEQVPRSQLRTSVHRRSPIPSRPSWLPFPDCGRDEAICSYFHRDGKEPGDYDAPSGNRPPHRRVVKLLHTRVETIWNFSKLARGLAKLQRFWCR